MRTRRTVMLALVVILGLLPMTLAPMMAAAGQAVLAQAEPESESEDEGGPGQQDPEAETGPGQGDEGGAEEQGPVWTYQMAWLGLGLVLLLLGGVAFTYWAFVARRQKV